MFTQKLPIINFARIHIIQSLLCLSNKATKLTAVKMSKEQRSFEIFTFFIEHGIESLHGIYPFMSRNN